ncbi:GNAT family N-acetyltransferase [Chitiniphilus shinanonensis]|uniref:GNAT family N-acetyltransferase n=1 Tax=Chitiniphilus shinanonensis TaxID=553088 RepID=UPI003075A1A3
MQVRPLVPADVRILIPAFLDAFNGPPWHDQWTEASAQRYLGGFAANPAARLFGIFDHDTPCGGLVGQIRHWWTGSECFIDELFIAPAHQGRGLGRALVDGAERLLAAEGIAALTLLTERDSAAERFYLGRGFEHRERLGFMSRMCDLQGR